MGDGASAWTSGWRRNASVAGAAIGVAAAGAAAGVALERALVGRGVRHKARLALDAAGPFGTLRGTPGTAVADDGTELHYEIDEIGEAGPDGTGQGPGQAPGRNLGRDLGQDLGAEPVPASVPAVPRPATPPSEERSPVAAADGPRPDAPLTVVFSHGYCLAQDSWHFQRAALRGAVRTVFWDQRSHGRSERGRAQRDPGTPVTIDQLGHDLKAVIEAAAPEGPVVLVGHSMGGMTMMALAAHHPELIRDRVVGAAFVGTSAGRLADVSFGLPVAGVKAARRVLPGLLRVLGSQVDLVERGRRVTADLFAGLVKRYSFGSKEVDPGVARFAERLIEATPIDVVAEFYPAFVQHEKSAALSAFDGLPVLVLAGEEDLITPSEHSTAIAEALPGAELVIVPEAGHLVMLEYPELVGDHLAHLLARAEAYAAARHDGAPYHRPV
ncbi:alpha/beta fold hydrolase [Streptomyces pactum]|uniref:alpha/beta fold hydrolase n=1 Tax=Streptomyces pactum TaxID=68249 RepID=UPI0036F6F932